MADTFAYKSGNHIVDCDTNNVLETKSQNGIKCVWSAKMYTYGYTINFIWKFDWNELKSEGVDEITGHIIVKSADNWFPTRKIDVKITEDNEEFTKRVQGECGDNKVSYEYFLIPHYAPIHEKSDYDKMFASSDQNDTILVVEGKKLHVNKTFLSYHSEYFRALFSSNFKEGQMNKIPIGDVSYEDFALLLSTFHPNPVFPNDKTVEKLLEMVLVSSAMSSAEHHLMCISRIDRERLLWMADEYGMPKLVEKCIRGLDTAKKAEKLKQSEEFEKLSDETKVKVQNKMLLL